MAAVLGFYGLVSNRFAHKMLHNTMPRERSTEEKVQEVLQRALAKSIEFKRYMRGGEDINEDSVFVSIDAWIPKCLWLLWPANRLRQSAVL